MNRPLILFAAPWLDLTELGLQLAKASGRPYRVVASPAQLEVQLVSGSTDAPVLVVAPEVMVNRERRVAAIDRAVVASFGLGAIPGHSADPNTELWMSLSAVFTEAHVCLAPKLLSDLGTCTEQLLALWKRDPIGVAAGELSYTVDVGRGVLESRLPATVGATPALLSLTDENVHRLHGQRLHSAIATVGARVVQVVLPPGEEHKHLGTLQFVYDQALEQGVDRSGRLLAVGGGVVTDIGGLVAATWMRGLSWVGVPTTLLAMVDASVGGKTAVDYRVAKNSVGAFWQPRGVICDVDFLATESDRNYLSAYGEVLKTALIGDAELFELLERESAAIRRRDPELLVEIVRRCVRVKARIVGLDERETGLRAVLNLGHTVGHALETFGEFTRWTHGEAVCLGMVAALKLGERLGHTPSTLVKRTLRLLEELGLPCAVEPEALHGCARYLGHDKKRAGSLIRFVFAKGLGAVGTEMVVLEDLRDWVPTLA